ncbi:hypothetical protein [Patulibacter sp.]|uniref:hypothetical protein n=1 Tax=Patulibacter sp. TaxID=1912859 RepID=UPI002726F987|nr:hypothetical protein [Patulibacter sp.]MDO9408300.1 hypothetical protein [Patulibacter sp.]
MKRPSLAVVLALAALLLLGPASAQAGQSRLHAHLDAYSGTNDCYWWQWNDKAARCKATEEHSVSQHGVGRGKYVRVEWCDPAHLEAGYCDGFLHGAGVASHTLPAGYSRWMLFESGHDTKILAAVKMPNGPFAVRGGVWQGHHLKASDTHAAVESHHGPLFLHVGYHGLKEARSGGSRTYGYVFGFRGYLNW